MHLPYLNALPTFHSTLIKKHLTKIILQNLLTFSHFLNAFRNFDWFFWRKHLHTQVLQRLLDVLVSYLLTFIFGNPSVALPSCFSLFLPVQIFKKPVLFWKFFNIFRIVSFFYSMFFIPQCWRVIVNSKISKSSLFTLCRLNHWSVLYCESTSY